MAIPNSAASPYGTPVVAVVRGGAVQGAPQSVPLPAGVSGGERLVTQQNVSLGPGGLIIPVILPSFGQSVAPGSATLKIPIIIAPTGHPAATRQMELPLGILIGALCVCIGMAMRRIGRPRHFAH